MPVKQRLSSRILDEKDKEIIMLLQKDGRMSLTEIAKKVRLSIDSVHNRIKAMTKKEVFSAGIFVNPRVIGYPLLADVKIKLKNISEESRNKLIKYLTEHKSVIDLLAVMGDYDLTCVLIAKNSDELEKISTEIRQRFKDLIDEWKSILILKTYKFEQYDLI
jgi:Lrp/AsnC family leucine-responsive transcriptional regulator